MAAPLAMLAGSVVGALVTYAGTFVGRVLISLGIGYVMYQGMDAGLDWAKSMVVSNLHGIPSTALQVAGVLKIGNAVSVLFSALSVRLMLDGMTSGTIKKMVVK